MPTISANATKKELDGIREYANACGESISNLIRKVMVREAIYVNCFGGSQDSLEQFGIHMAQIHAINYQKESLMTMLTRKLDKRS